MQLSACLHMDKDTIVFPNIQVTGIVHSTSGGTGGLVENHCRNNQHLYSPSKRYLEMGCGSKGNTREEGLGGLENHGADLYLKYLIMN
jgi:hypothetical protein